MPLFRNNFQLCASLPSVLSVASGMTLHCQQTLTSAALVRLLVHQISSTVYSTVQRKSQPFSLPASKSKGSSSGHGIHLTLANRLNLWSVLSTFYQAVSRQMSTTSGAMHKVLPLRFAWLCDLFRRIILWIQGSSAGAAGEWRNSPRRSELVCNIVCRAAVVRSAALFVC